MKNKEKTFSREEILNSVHGWFCGHHYERAVYKDIEPNDGIKILVDNGHGYFKVSLHTEGKNKNVRKYIDKMRKWSYNKLNKREEHSLKPRRVLQ